MLCRSNPQRLVACSSFEAELNAVHFYRGLVITLRSLLSDFGIDQVAPSLLLQDNGATLLSLRRGQVFHGRSTHIDMRYFYQNQLQHDGVVTFEWCPTLDMDADPMTKPMIYGVDLAKLIRLCNESV